MLRGEPGAPDFSLGGIQLRVETQRVNRWGSCSPPHPRLSLLLPPGPSCSHCQAVLPAAFVFACLFFVAPRQQCSFFFPFLFFSFLSVEACSAFSQDWVGSSQGLSVSFDKDPSIRLSISDLASLIGGLVTPPFPREDSRGPFSTEYIRISE